MRRRHKRSRRQQREVGRPTSQPIIAPTPMEPPEGTPLAPPPTAYPLEPGELPNEGYNSIIMSRAPEGARYVSHYDATPMVLGTSCLDQKAIDAAHPASRG